MQTEDSQPSRKAREEEFRRNLVLDHAEELFAMKGFDGTTVSDIAQASELAKGSLYQLFQSKEEIIAAIIGRKLDQIRSEIDEILSQPVSPTEKIRAIIASKLRVVGENWKFARIFFHELHGFHWCVETPLMEIYRKEIGELLKRLEEVFKEGQQLGEFRNDVSSATLLAAMGGFSNGVIFIWFQNPERINLDEMVREVQELFLEGALAS